MGEHHLLGRPMCCSELEDRETETARERERERDRERERERANPQKGRADVVDV